MTALLNRPTCRKRKICHTEHTESEVVQKSSKLSRSSLYQSLFRSVCSAGEQWIHARIQKLQNVNSRAVEFASVEYFEWVTQHPEAKEWFALGQSMHVVIEGKFIDVRPAKQ